MKFPPGTTADQVTNKDGDECIEFVYLEHGNKSNRYLVIFKGYLGEPFMYDEDGVCDDGNEYRGDHTLDLIYK